MIFSKSCLGKKQKMNQNIEKLIDDNVQTFYTGVLLMNGRQKDDVKLFCKPKDVNSCVKQM